MKKTLLSVVLLLSSLFAATASTNTEAATTNYTDTQWEYYAAAEYDGGSGTEDDPYLIATVEQFMKLAVEIQNLAFDDNNWNDEYSAGKYWLQTADLVFNEDVLSRVVFASGDASSLSSTSDLLTFTGVGYYLDEYDYQVFAGTYDGGGHKISGLYINAGSNKSTGLFNNLWGGTVKNLVIEDAYLTGNANVGFVVGKVENGSSIYNCQTSGIIYCGGSYHAGIAGYVDASQVYNCTSDAWLWAKNNEGGICGRGSNSTEVNNCFFNGWIGAVYSNTAKFTAWGAIVSELGASETTTEQITIEGTDTIVTTICENPSTVKNSYWTDTCTVRHFSGSAVEAISASLSTYGVTENTYAVSTSDLATTVAALNETATGLVEACGWELDENNRPVLTFETIGTTEISNVTTKAENRTVVGYYTLDGMRVSEPVNGVNIVKFSDGSTIKIIK